jgi:hypothetical protein
MIKIRYVDPNKISPGLHAAVECHGRSTTVYLLCGLRPEQRRAAFRRLRMSARTGYCPALPAPQLALARFRDRIRTGLGQAGAVFRSHPAATTVPLVLVSAGAIAFLLLSAVSLRVLPGPRTPAAGLAPLLAAPLLAAPAGEPPLPGGLIPAARSGPGSELLAPALRESIGVAAFTPQPAVSRSKPSDSNAPTAP